MKKYLLFVYTLLFILSACSAPAAETQEDETAADMTDVSLTDAQAKSLGVHTGTLTMHSFQGEIEANGTLAVMPQSEADVSTFIDANVTALHVHEGQTVQKGQPLITLSHPSIVNIQSEYLTAYHRMAYTQQEYERQQILYNEKIASGKEFQQIQSEYRTLQAEISSLEAKLEMIGINLQNLRKGQISRSVSVKAPISGTIEQIFVKTGEYANSEKPLLCIVNSENIYADLLVFEKDVPYVKEGQTVHLSLRAASGAEYTGKIYSVGKTFEENPRAVHVRVSLDGSHEGLITGTYLCGHIASNTQSLPAIAEDGLVEEDGKTYLFTATHNSGHWTYHPVEVQKGRSEGGFVEVILPKSLNSSTILALDQAYYLLSEMKKSETGEE